MKAGRLAGMVLVAVFFVEVVDAAATMSATNKTVVVASPSKGAAESAKKIVYTHKDTGFRFPERFREYEYVKITDYNGDGTDVGVNYATQDGLGFLTLYVYPAPKGTVGPSVYMDEKGQPVLSSAPGEVYELADPSELYDMEYAKVIESVLASRPGWELGSYGESRRRAMPDKNGPVSYRTVFSGMSPDYPVNSDFLLFVTHGHFVKVRATYPVEKALEYSWVDEFPVVDVEDDQLNTVKILKRNAEAGDIPSVYALGMAYVEGRGVPSQPATGVPWLKKVADLGDIPTMFLLAALNANAYGIPQNYEEAAKWYGKAADLGDVPSMCELGLLLVEGKGVKADPEKGAVLIRQAANMQYPKAMTYLGCLYLEGTGVPLSKAEGIKWLEASVQLGDTAAASVLRSHRDGETGE